MRIGSSKIGAAILVTALLVAGCSPAGMPSPGATVAIEASATLPQPSPTSTFTPLPSATPIRTEPPSSISSYVYYMIVLDASANMQAMFDGKTRWEAARESVGAILSGLEPGANYGLVLIGGVPTIEGVDPCNEPSVLKTPFSSRNIIDDQIAQLQPAGGGSLYTAFNLAKNQFYGLPENTIRVLIYVTSSSDACKSREEWTELERLFEIPGGMDENLYSEIIILDEDPDAQTISASIKGLSEKINVQAPQSIPDLQPVYTTALDNVSNYVDTAIANFPTSTPEITPTFPPTLESGTPTVIASNTATPSITPSPTPTLLPSVELLSANYLTTGAGCQIDIVVRVTGSPAMGSFTIWNASDGLEGKADSAITLPVGTYSGNSVTLSGNQPDSYVHEVWFEYGGIQSNRLQGLVCPLLPRATPTP